MPRACSTLLQNIFNQNPNFHSTPTDGVADLLLRAREGFTMAPEFKAQDQDLMLKAWRSFCKGGIYGYSRALTDKQYVVLKSRAWKSNYDWLKNFLGEPPKIVCMVRDMRGIIASFEKLHRKNPDKTSQWLIAGELRGTTVEKRVDMYVQNPPLGSSIDQVREIIQLGHQSDICFIRAEDLSSNPQYWMDVIYKYLGIDTFKHNFDNVEQTTHEDDRWHGLDNNLHTIKNKVEPIVEDYEQVLGTDVCNWVNGSYAWYQQIFGYLQPQEQVNS